MDVIHDSLVKDGGGGTPKHFLHDIYINYIKDKDISTVVEIGVYNGCFLLPITFMNSNKKTYGIDPYINFVQADIDNPHIKKVADGITTNQLFLDKVYERLISNISKFNLNIYIIKDYSENVYNKFDDNSIDILRIDGNHDTNFVFKDLELYIKKIKINGIVLMDDTNWSSVVKAMNDFLDAHKNIILERREKEFCVLRKI
jgi:hypothetical protein